MLFRQTFSRMFNSHVRLVHCRPRGWPSPNVWDRVALVPAQDPWSNGASFFDQLSLMDLSRMMAMLNQFSNSYSLNLLNRTRLISFYILPFISGGLKMSIFISAHSFPRGFIVSVSLSAVPLGLVWKWAVVYWHTRFNLKTVHIKVKTTYSTQSP